MAFRWIPFIDETVVKLVSIVLSSAFDVYEQAFGERDDPHHDAQGCALCMLPSGLGTGIWMTDSYIHIACSGVAAP